MIELECAKQRLRHFAETVLTRSPLCAVLSARAADDDEVAGLLTVGRDEDADAPLLFAAANYLLATMPQHRLARYYPNLHSHS
ncbi:DUF2332 family protein [Nocardia sp. NPDC052112]|uniref:DUF2332 family protein n=1 Tax=Nocardia sp. NPDC052112 TaxID=3155646 RepID=UPI00342B46EC